MRYSTIYNCSCLCVTSDHTVDHQTTAMTWEGRLMNNQTERQRNRQVIRKTDTLRKSPRTDNVVINLSGCRWEGISCIHTVPKEYHATTFLWGFLFCNTISRFLFRGIKSKKASWHYCKIFKNFILYILYIWELLGFFTCNGGKCHKKVTVCPHWVQISQTESFNRDAKVNSVSDKIKKTK